MSDNTGSKVYSFSPDKVIKWLEKNKLIGEKVWEEKQESF